MASVALFLVKLMLVARLSPFGDEAFYWQESLHLAWGYSDLPPLTAWLIPLGETVAGHGFQCLLYLAKTLGPSLTSPSAVESRWDDGLSGLL
ncbi:hypothetical protein [Dyella sp. Tek66A03]|uniref:hypothetical protein n=1 Tax=Dyella sp. Tek66A03 TaxID=3458298 RepID=UPI00403EC848